MRGRAGHPGREKDAAAPAAVIVPHGHPRGLITAVSARTGRNQPKAFRFPALNLRSLLKNRILHRAPGLALLGRNHGHCWQPSRRATCGRTATRRQYRFRQGRCRGRSTQAIRRVRVRLQDSGTSRQPVPGANRIRRPALPNRGFRARRGRFFAGVSPRQRVFKVARARLTNWAKRSRLRLRKRGAWKRTAPQPHQVEILRLALEQGQAQAAAVFGLTRQRVHSLTRRWKTWTDENLQHSGEENAVIE